MFVLKANWIAHKSHLWLENQTQGYTAAIVTTTATASTVSVLAQVLGGADTKLGLDLEEISWGKCLWEKIVSKLEETGRAVWLV